MPGRLVERYSGLAGVPVGCNGMILDDKGSDKVLFAACCCIKHSAKDKASFHILLGDEVLRIAAVFQRKARQLAEGKKMLSLDK